MTREEKRKKQKEERIKQLIKIYSIIALCEIVLLGLLIFGIVKTNNKSDKIDKPTINDNTISIDKPSMITSADIKIDEPKMTATLTVVGDIMMHKWQIERGYDAASDSFDYADSYTYIAKYLDHADMTIGNLETTFAGRNMGAGKEVYGYSGYPMFNAPEVLGQNLKDVGFDFLQTANNHSLDAWEDGLYATIDQLDSLGIKHTGTFKTKEENEEPCIIEINGITFGFVAYTYATNGLPVTSDAPYCINTLDLYDNAKLEEMYQKVRELDQAGVDFVCPLIHFGTEYTESPDSWQEMVVDGLIDAGADVIFGGHPHVIEPMDLRYATNADGSTRPVYIFYSFGNFISSQVFDGVNKDLGIIADLTFSKETVNGVTTAAVEEIKIEPTYVYWTDDVIGIVPVLEVFNNKGNFSFLSAKDMGRIDFAKDHVIELLTSYGNLQYTIEEDKYVVSPK